MNNKYYTPSLEEFHLGFRYEYKSTYDPTYLKNTNGEWAKRVFENYINGREGEHEWLDINIVRVKYLDRDDIEELGWVYKGNHWFYKQDKYYEFNIDEDSSYFLHAHHYLSEEPVRYSIINGSPTHLYGLSDSSYVFDGEIRNYNELKFIMERVGINSKDDKYRE